MTDLPTVSWFLVIVVGTAVLGLAIAYGLWRSRQRSRVEDRRGEQATHDLYETEDHRPGP